MEAVKDKVNFVVYKKTNIYNDKELKDDDSNNICVNHSQKEAIFYYKKEKYICAKNAW